MSSVLLEGVFCLLLVGFCALLAAASATAQEENLRVLSDEARGPWMQYTDASNALYHHLSAQAYQRLEQRAETVSKLKTQSQWRQRQKDVRNTLHDIVGPFPEKTPLNARVVDTLDKDGYHVENLVYESQPGFYVTASLFVPDGLQEPAPAILFCSGHSIRAYRRPYYQRAVLNLVEKGFIVLAFDPVGQGERLQYFDPETGQSRVGGSTDEHSYSGAQAFVSKSSQARYMIWDGIRGIDYLMSREEVDPDRIGCHGLSGGGTQSAYIAAFDERVKAVAPAGYITSFQRLLETIGPQDAEQNFYHGIARGIDHADLLEVRAPKPALIVATTRDFFSIQGARETYEEAKRAYEAFGKPEHLTMVEDEHGHGYTEENLEAIYAFFQKHLGLPGRSEHKDLPFLSPEELQVTETGQIATLLEGAETVFSLNRAQTQPLIGKLKQSRENLAEHLPSVKRSAKALSGFERPEGASEAVFTGRYQREGYAVEKYFIQGEGDYVVPFLLMVPEGEGPHPAVVYLHPEGKAAEARPGGRMEWLAKQGYIVMAPDLLGSGEMGSGAFQGDSHIEGISYNRWFESVLVGRSITGVLAGDIVRAVRFLENRTGVEPEAIAAIGHEEMTPALLHAAAFEPALSKVALVEPLISYRSLVTNKYYDPRFIPTAVAGALTGYDLPDLAASLAPRRLLMVNPVDEDGEHAGAELREKNLSAVRSAYAAREATSKLKVQMRESHKSMDEVFSSWLK